MSQILVPTNLLDSMVGFVEVSSVTTKRALDEVVVHRQSQEKAAQLRPELLKHMIASGVVKAAQKEAADAMLASHPETLALLKSATDKIVELKAQITGGTKTAGDLGRGEGGSAPEAPTSLNGPYVGGHNTGLSESDRILLQGAGITR